ncbi:hypothetical protein MRB53_037430 [Persea americana]|nr:hypothetical protein MRB53_037430 [Persea americana]
MDASSESVDMWRSCRCICGREEKRRKVEVDTSRCWRVILSFLVHLVVQCVSNRYRATAPKHIVLGLPLSNILPPVRRPPRFHPRLIDPPKLSCRSHGMT